MYGGGGEARPSGVISTRSVVTNQGPSHLLQHFPSTVVFELLLDPSPEPNLLGRMAH